MLRILNNYWKKLIINFRELNHKIQISHHSSIITHTDWTGEFKNEIIANLNKNHIYAYQSKEGGIYKTMSLSLIGNCDFNKFGIHWLGSPRYIGFVRIDNVCGYCQFMYYSLEKVFDLHFNSLHKHYEIYEFTNQEDFFKWCLNRPKQYK